MSFRCKGVTHCEICGKILKMDEIGKCKECKPYMLSTTTRRYGKTVQQAINLIDQLDKDVPLNKIYGIQRIRKGCFVILKEEYISLKCFVNLKEKIHNALDENGFSRAYQAIIDEYFNEILNAEKERYK